MNINSLPSLINQDRLIKRKLDGITGVFSNIGKYDVLIAAGHKSKKIFDKSFKFIIYFFTIVISRSASWYIFSFF